MSQKEEHFSKRMSISPYCPFQYFENLLKKRRLKFLTSIFSTCFLKKESFIHRNNKIAWKLLTCQTNFTFHILYSYGISDSDFHEIGNTPVLFWSLDEVVHGMFCHLGFCLKPDHEIFITFSIPIMTSLNFPTTHARLKAMAV